MQIVDGLSCQCRASACIWGHLTASHLYAKKGRSCSKVLSNFHTFEQAFECIDGSCVITSYPCLSTSLKTSDHFKSSLNEFKLWFRPGVDESPRILAVWTNCSNTLPSSLRFFFFWLCGWQYWSVGPLTLSRLKYLMNAMIVCTDIHVLWWLSSPQWCWHF